MSPSEMVQRAIQSARAGRRTEARDLLLAVVESDPQNEAAWMWLSGLVDSLQDRIIACENVLTINPANEKVRGYLAELQRYQQGLLTSKNTDEAQDLLQQAKGLVERNDFDAALQQAKQLKADPLARAKQLEQLGRFDDALNAYKALAGKARNSREFDQIYKQILRVIVKTSSDTRGLTQPWRMN